MLKALKHYPEVVRTFEKSEPTCAAFLMDAECFYDGDKTIFRLKNGFHLKMLESKQAAVILQAIIRSIEGIDAKVVFELYEEKKEQHNDLSELSDA